jgi:hypothetical protein
MDSKTEAKRIFNLFFLSSLKVSHKQAKEFSLVTVKEIMKTNPINPDLQFWINVETEIKLINEKNK